MDFTDDELGILRDALNCLLAELPSDSRSYYVEVDALLDKVKELEN